MNEQAADIKVSGNVQAVFFRGMTCNEAKRLNLSGYVANHSDGTVRIYCEGEEANITKLIEWIRSNPGNSNVSHVDMTTSAVSGSYSNFTIKHV